MRIKFVFDDMVDMAQQYLIINHRIIYTLMRTDELNLW